MVRKAFILPRETSKNRRSKQFNMKIILAAAGAVLFLANNVAFAKAGPVPSAEQAECATGVQIISARGSYQAPGIGSMAPLVNAIMQKVPGSMAVGLDYPAVMKPVYRDSEDAGAKNMTKYIQYFAEKCPNTKQVLVGYSQGAQVTMDALCGSPTLRTGPLGPSYRDISKSHCMTLKEPLIAIG